MADYTLFLDWLAERPEFGDLFTWVQTVPVEARRLFARKRWPLSDLEGAPAETAHRQLAAALMGHAVVMTVQVAQIRSDLILHGADLAKAGMVKTWDPGDRRLILSSGHSMRAGRSDEVLAVPRADAAWVLAEAVRYGVDLPPNLVGIFARVDPQAHEHRPSGNPPQPWQAQARDTLVRLGPEIGKRLTSLGYPGHQPLGVTFGEDMVHATYHKPVMVGQRWRREDRATEFTFIVFPSAASPTGYVSRMFYHQGRVPYQGPLLPFDLDRVTVDNLVDDDWVLGLARRRAAMERLDRPDPLMLDSGTDPEIVFAAYRVHGERMEGGKGDGRDPTEFDLHELTLGQRVELEHTRDPLLALEVAIDHCTEDPLYYTHLLPCHRD